MAIANKVVSGTAATASAFNALVDAVQDASTGHEHSGAPDMGTPVTHHDLIGATDGGTGQSHAAIDAFVTGALRWGGAGADPTKALRLEMGDIPGANDYWAVSGAGYATTITTTLDHVVGGVFTPTTGFADGYRIVPGVAPNANTFELFTRATTIATRAGFWLVWGWDD